jgi:hypothetical protein
MHTKNTKKNNLDGKVWIILLHFKVEWWAFKNWAPSDFNSWVPTLQHLESLLGTQRSNMSPIKFCWLNLSLIVATPLWDKCEGEAHTPKSGSWSLPRLLKIQSLTLGVKSPRIWVFFMSLESSWSVDVQNGLAWAIWTSTAQVMGKRRARSQTGNLTSDH